MTYKLLFLSVNGCIINIPPCRVDVFIIYQNNDIGKENDKRNEVGNYSEYDYLKETH